MEIMNGVGIEEKNKAREFREKLTKYNQLSCLSPKSREERRFPFLISPLFFLFFLIYLFILFVLRPAIAYEISRHGFFV